MIVDDYEPYIHPRQRQQWVAIRPFDAPYPEDDRELTRIRTILERVAPREARGEVPPTSRTPGQRHQASAVPFRVGDRGPELLLVTSISSGSNCARRHSLPPTARAPRVLP